MHQQKLQKKRMPKRQPPKNSNWVQLTKGFVKEWPEVLEGMKFQNMPVSYLLFITLILKNNISIKYHIQKELKYKSHNKIAKSLKAFIEQHYKNIIGIELKFDVPTLKKDMENKTSQILKRSFK